MHLNYCSLPNMQNYTSWKFCKKFESYLTIKPANSYFVNHIIDLKTRKQL